MAPASRVQVAMGCKITACYPWAGLKANSKLAWKVTPQLMVELEQLVPPYVASSEPWQLRFAATREV